MNCHIKMNYGVPYCIDSTVLLHLTVSLQVAETSKGVVCWSKKKRVETTTSKKYPTEFTQSSSRVQLEFKYSTLNQGQNHRSEKETTGGLNAIFDLATIYIGTLAVFNLRKF